jgi:hypothetical protein
MRTILTDQKSNLKYMLGVAVIGAACSIYIRLSEPPYVLIPRLVSFFVWPVLFFMLFYLKVKSIKIEFDDKNLYLVQNKIEETIPLKKILDVTMTGIGARGLGGNRSQYRISCVDSFDIEHEINFMLYWQYRQSFDQFLDMIRINNPEVKIKNWATNFDPLIHFVNKIRKKKHL